MYDAVSYYRISRDGAPARKIFQGVGMQPQDSENVVADLIDVYRTAVANATEAELRSRDPHLPMRERLVYRHRAHEAQDLADQALRMVNELTTRVAA